MFWKKRKHVKVLLHRHHADVYQDGRYLHIDAKLSLKSKRDCNALRDLVFELMAIAEPFLDFPKREIPTTGAYPGNSGESSFAVPDKQLETRPGVAGLDP